MCTDIPAQSVVTQEAGPPSHMMADRNRRKNNIVINDFLSPLTKMLISKSKIDRPLLYICDDKTYNLFHPQFLKILYTVYITRYTLFLNLLNLNVHKSVVVKGKPIVELI